MQQIIVVYETDAWHSLNTRECAGIYTSKRAAINSIVKNHRIELEDIFEIETTEMSRTELRKLQKEARSIIGKQLDRYYQTQGYQTNYEIEIWNLNDWGL